MFSKYSSKDTNQQWKLFYYSRVICVQAIGIYSTAFNITQSKKKCKIVFNILNLKTTIKGLGFLTIISSITKHIIVSYFCPLVNGQ